MMNFTAEIFAAIAEDLRTKPVNDAKSAAMRLVVYTNTLSVAFAVSKVNGLRAIYLSVDNSAKKAKFPKWSGVCIELAALPDYGSDDLYVAMKELPHSSPDIFEIVAEDLRKAIEELCDPSLALNTVTSVLAKWKNFFQYEGDVLMSEIRQQGLMGELVFLKEAITEIGTHSVAKWSGCNDETHDFYFSEHGVEIKTTSTKEPYKAHISSEYQLDVADVPGKLFLGFYALRKSQSSGTTLVQMVASIRETLISAPAMLSQFNEKLRKYGYFDEVSELYITGYYVRDAYFFLVNSDFPCITKGKLKNGITNVEYKLSIGHCMNCAIGEEALFTQLKGDMTDAE